MMDRKKGNRWNLRHSPAPTGESIASEGLVSGFSGHAYGMALARNGWSGRYKRPGRVKPKNDEAREGNGAW